jgi:protein arginine kinase activator
LGASYATLCAATNDPSRHRTRRVPRTFVPVGKPGDAPWLIEEDRVFAEESPDWNVDPSGSVTCELCGEEPATLHLLRVVDGTVSHTHLCPSCAESMAQETEGLALVLAVPSALRNLTKGVPAAEPAPTLAAEQDVRFCAVCGTTLSDVKESGLVGCIKCYEVFAEYLEASLEQATEPVEHLGKIPRRGPETDTLRHEMLRLERMLRELVECERFEEAAGVRDRLAELGRRLGGERA